MVKKHCLKSVFSVPLFMAAALFVAACGSSEPATDAAKGADSKATTTIAAPTTVAAGEEGIEENPILVDAEFCESLPTDTFSESAGGVVTKATFLKGGGVSDGTTYDTSSCKFALDNDSEVVVSMMFDPESGSSAGTDLFEALHEGSKRNPNASFEHSDVAGIGDNAVFMADEFNNKIMVLTSDMVFTIEGKDGDFETLERAVVKQIAEDAFSDNG